MKKPTIREELAKTIECAMNAMRYSFDEGDQEKIADAILKERRLVVRRRAVRRKTRCPWCHSTKHPPAFRSGCPKWDKAVGRKG